MTISQETSDIGESAANKKYQVLKLIAQEALKQYELKCNSVEFMVEETNMFFKVTCKDGTNYALKIFQEESSSLDDNRAEIYFLNQLKYIETSEVIKNKHGEGITIVKSKHTDIPKRVAIYTWLEGEDFEGNETEELFTKVGELAAMLHLQTMGLNIPADIKPKKWDKVFYYEGEEPVYKQGKYAEFVDEETIEVMDKIIPYLNTKLSDFYNKDLPQLLHADLNPWNIKVHEGKLRLLDFEEAMLAYPVHDIAIMLYYYRYSKSWRYEKVKKLVISGYKKIIPQVRFDDEDLETLMIARRVNFLNYVLVIDNDPGDFIKMCKERIKEFMVKRNLL